MWQPTATRAEGALGPWLRGGRAFPWSTCCVVSISLLTMSPSERGAISPHVETETAALFDPVSLLWLPASTAVLGLEVEIKVPAR